jgi:hypothetical protein
MGAWIPMAGDENWVDIGHADDFSKGTLIRQFER